MNRHRNGIRAVTKLNVREQELRNMYNIYLHIYLCTSANRKKSTVQTTSAKCNTTKGELYALYRYFTSLVYVHGPDTFNPKGVKTPLFNTVQKVISNIPKQVITLFPINHFQD